MAEFESCIVPFPLQRSPLHESEGSHLPAEAAAELRGVMLGNLLDQLADLMGCSRQTCAYGSLLTQLWICSTKWSCSIVEPYPRREEVRDEQRRNDLPASHDGHPGVEIIWAADCREAFNQA
nr:LasR-specific antiactivator QslA [Pseudomonas oleovorans]